jgi:hypothetical protein
MEWLTWVLFGPAKLVAWQPYAAVGLGLVLIGVELLRWISEGQAASRDVFRRPGVFAGLLWCIFNFYELQLLAVFSASGQTNSLFRLDLIVLTPLLYALSAYAAFSWIRR